jgi:hypothetical protein
MPWSGCSTTSEFVELMNFGPGPMDIGCYIVTNGKYSVTIPPNTIVQPGHYYVLSGQNSLTQPCGNVDSTVSVDLNWTTCNCTNQAVPTTGDGFFQNGGSANEKVVLMDPNLNVLDAVARATPISSSVSITTSSVSGACTSKTFNLSTMPVSYEAMNVSTGIDNSFARRVDGDCGWVKTTDISADASNKTGSTASATYSFSTLNASQCNGTTGSISIGVSSSNVSSLFPMSYTLAYDSDSNNIFNSTDIYTYGVDSSASSIDINNLAYGRYRITVGSAASGCNLQSYDFFIFNCYGVVLPYRIISFQYNGNRNGQLSFDAKINGIANIDSVILEGSNSDRFMSVTTLRLSGSVSRENKPISLFAPQAPLYKFYRLKIIDHNKVITYSKEIRILQVTETNVWPNPCKEKMFVKITSSRPRQSAYRIYNGVGQIISTKNIILKEGINVLPVETGQLNKGNYHLSVPNDLESYTTYRFHKE